MSDERVAESPNPRPCPVCATGFCSTPGKSCPGCGRVFAPLPVLRDADVRLKTERFRLDGPGWVFVGIGLLIGVLFLAYEIGAGVIIPLVMVMLPALIRTLRLFRARENDSAFALFATFLAALGVSILIGAAAAVACIGVCAAIVLGSGIERLEEAVVASGITAVIVFIALFVTFWPREVPLPKRDPGEGPNPMRLRDHTFLGRTQNHCPECRASSAEEIRRPPDSQN